MEPEKSWSRSLIEDLGGKNVGGRGLDLFSGTRNDGHDLAPIGTELARHDDTDRFRKRKFGIRVKRVTDRDLAPQ
jgi:hypothetical protein